MAPRNDTTGIELQAPESRAIVSSHTNTCVCTNIRYTAIFPKLLIMSDTIKFLARIERMKVGEGGDITQVLGQGTALPHLVQMANV